MTSNQIKWAAAHDWFIQDNHDGSVLVRDEYVKAGIVFRRVRKFSSYRALRNWAGY